MSKVWKCLCWLQPFSCSVSPGVGDTQRRRGWEEGHGHNAQSFQPLQPLWQPHPELWKDSALPDLAHLFCLHPRCFCWDRSAAETVRVCQDGKPRAICLEPLEEKSCPTRLWCSLHVGTCGSIRAASRHQALPVPVHTVRVSLAVTGTLHRVVLLLVHPV